MDTRKPDRAARAQGVGGGPALARWCAWPCVLACCGLGGCANFWDDVVTNREFHLKMMFAGKPDPLSVLANSSDGDKRARALRALQEPLAHGGTPEQQEVVVKALVWSAANEKQALCRLAAIHSLRTFKDPRALEGLKEAYYHASSFNPDTATVIKCQALQALGDNNAPGAVELLVKVLHEPPVEGSEIEKQQKMDERIAAARALGQFKQYQATEALVDVLRQDRDVALRNRANESLQLATGKDFPADAEVWANFLHSTGQDPALEHKPSVMGKMIELVSDPGQ